MMWRARCDAGEDDDQDKGSETQARRQRQANKWKDKEKVVKRRIGHLERGSWRGWRPLGSSGSCKPPPLPLTITTSGLIAVCGYRRLSLMLVSILIIITMMSALNQCAKTPPNTGKPALDDDDLIEGRLDSSRLCGTRYPINPYQRRKLRLESGGSSSSNNNYYNNDDNKEEEVAEENDVSNERHFDNGNNLLYIVGGDEVDDDQLWPWSVAIYELDPLNGQRAFICSGSLISEKYILTAAHCIQQSRFDILTPDEIFLKVASVRLDDDRSDFYKVEKIYIHPEYTVDRKTNDIALLKLKHGQRLPYRARPICLPSNVANRIDFTDQQVTIIGWGKTSAMQGNEPSRLIDIVSEDGTLDSDEGGADETTDSSSPPPPPHMAQSFQRNGDNDTDIISNIISRERPQQRRRRRRRERDDAGRPGEANNANNEQTAKARQTGGDASQTNDTLLQAQVRVTSNDKCNRDYSRLEISWLNIDDHFLCASDPQGKRDACQGDSGGPLMWNNLYGNNKINNNNNNINNNPAYSQEKWYQLGLVSFGYGCANRQYPGVYTRITYYMPWILKIVNERKGNGMFGSMINHHHQQQQQQQKHNQHY